MTFCLLQPLLADEVARAVEKPGVQTPGDWLVWAKVPRLTNLEKQADKLLEPFGIRLVGAKQILQMYCGNALSDDRPIVAGFVASEQSSETTIDGESNKQNFSPEPFLILPIDDLKKFASARQFSMEEDLWLTTLLGVEFRITPIDRAIWITRLDTNAITPNNQQISKLLSTGQDEEPEPTKLLQLSLSKGGLDYLIEITSAERKALLSQPRKKIPTLKLPRTLPELRGQLTRYVPFLKSIAKASNQGAEVLIDCDLHIRENSIELKLDFASESPSLDFKASAERISSATTEIDPQLAKLLPEKQAISHFVSTGTIDPTLLDLVAGYFICYPDEVEALNYNERAYQEYTNKLNALMRSSTSMELIDLLVDDSQPIAAGQAILLQFPTHEQPKVAEQLSELIDLWNRLLIVSKARLKFEAKQETIDFETTAGEKLEATRVSIDMIEAFGSRRYEEIVALFEAIYGPDCLYRTDLINLGDGRWLLSRLSEAENKRIVDQLLKVRTEDTVGEAPKQSWQLMAKINPARYQDWNIRLDEISNRETIGNHPMPVMAECPPFTVAISRNNNRLTATIDLPLSTYHTGVEFFRNTTKP